jgi:two-component system response regulator CpxR
MTDSKHILLVDDDKDIVELLSAYLSSEGYQLTCCYDGVSGLQAMRNGQFDLVLLDVMMPGLTGFEVLSALGGVSQTPIMMLTAKGDDQDRILGLELGADDYLAKPFNHRELLARIQAIFRRVDLLKQPSTSANKTLNVNHIELNLGTRTVTFHQQAVELTGTEFQVLQVLMEHAGEIVSKEILYQQVLGRRISAFDRSIDMHVSNIRRKLSKINDRELIKTIRGSGYLLMTGH